MEIQQFYYFMPRFSSASTVLATNDELTYGPNAMEYALGKRNPRNTLVLKQVSGKRWDDMLTRVKSLYIVSTNFITILKENNLTGWKAFPIKIITKTGEEVDNYWGLSIIGRCANKLEPTPQNWDGKDFFIMKDTISTYITEKAYKCLKGKVTNIQFVKYEENIEGIRRVRLMGEM